jgi:hypothetical protein
MKLISYPEISKYDILEWRQLELQKLKQINDSFILIGLTVRALSNRVRNPTEHVIKSFFRPSFIMDESLENRWRDFYEI